MSSSGPESPLGDAPASILAFEPIAEGGSACSVRLPAFEGPLDLLLHLIREDELDITNLPIARVAVQYLEYLGLMRELRLDVAAEYLVMAATLAWIKSRLLLPPSEDDELDEELDPRAELVARLLAYQRYKEAATELERRPLLDRDVFAARGAELPEPEEGEREIQVGLVQLVDALRRVLKEAPEGTAIHQVVSEPVTVRECMVALVDALEAADSLEFEAWLRGPGEAPLNRSILVATFLAILELARVSVLRIYQSLDEDGAPRGPIRLRRAVGGTELRERLPELA